MKLSLPFFPVTEKVSVLAFPFKVIFIFPFSTVMALTTLLLPEYLKVPVLTVELFTPLGRSRRKVLALLSDPISPVETGILIDADFVSAACTEEFKKGDNSRLRIMKKDNAKILLIFIFSIHLAYLQYLNILVPLYYQLSDKRK